MISTIIARGTDEERKEKALFICKEQQIDIYDQQIFSPPTSDEKGSAEEKFGIALIRKIKQHAILKPVYSKWSAIVILEAHLLTLPAQQALLKLLEEPPEQTIIILTADREESFLPTICSRCKIVHLESSLKKPLQQDEIINKIILQQDISLGERLSFAETISKDHPELWIKEFIIAAREHMLKAINSDDLDLLRRMPKSLTSAQEAERLLSTTNANQRLVIEQLLLSI